ncbi:DUF6207 family protein [Streptomyces sp. NPDC048361]|uniref:DUF6207 family protein n=1 Tax=Streptomyces sp. NPDC048361 TaxID=3154720 RepID=UPI0034165402
MDAIDPVHLSEPGLLVIDITAADDTTAQAAVAALDALWATSGPGRTHRVPGQPGAHVRGPSAREPGDRLTPEQLSRKRLATQP